MSSGLSYDVVIVGAGIVGASIAWHACRKKLRIGVIDATGPAAGASGTADGALAVATKTSKIMAGLAGESLDYAKTLSRQGGVLDGVFFERPTFVFASSKPEEAALDRLVSMLGDPSLPVNVCRDSHPGCCSITGLGKSVTRIVELAGEGHMLGYEAVRAFLSGCDAEMHWPCKLEELETTRTRVRLHTSLGEITAGKVVIATGLGTASFFPDLPLLPRSGQLIVTDRSCRRICGNLPGPLTSAAYLLDKSNRTGQLPQAPVVIDPLRTGQLLIGSSREDGGSPASTDFDTVRNILASGVRCLPALANANIIRVFAGVRTACSDSLPVIGEVPGSPNVILATGFDGDGICMAVIVGRHIAGMLAGESAGCGFTPLSPSRFDQPSAMAL